MLCPKGNSNRISFCTPLSPKNNFLVFLSLVFSLPFGLTLPSVWCQHERFMPPTSSLARSFFAILLLPLFNLHQISQPSPTKKQPCPSKSVSTDSAASAVSSCAPPSTTPTPPSSPSTIPSFRSTVSYYYFLGADCRFVDRKIPRGFNGMDIVAFVGRASHASVPRSHDHPR